MLLLLILSPYSKRYKLLLKNSSILTIIWFNHAADFRRLGLNMAWHFNQNDSKTVKYDSTVISLQTNAGISIKKAWFVICGLISFSSNRLMKRTTNTKVDIMAAFKKCWGIAGQVDLNLLSSKF